MTDPVGRTPGDDQPEGFYRVLVEHAVDPFVVVDQQLDIVYVSPTITQLLGHDPEALRGMSALDLLSPDSRDLAIDALGMVLPSAAQPNSRNNPVRMQLLDAHGRKLAVNVLASAAPAETTGGVVLQLGRAGAAQVMNDAVNAILEGRDHERVLALLASVIEHDISESSATLASGWNGRGFARVAGSDGPLDLRAPNPLDRVAITTALGGPDELVDLHEELAPETREAAAALGRHGCWLAQVRVGREREASAALVVWNPTPGPPGPVYRDDLRRAIRVAELGLQWELQQRLLAWDASHDRLTRLANRVELQERLDRGAGPRAVLFCDLDDFKPVNDRYGHRYGDAVLVAVARRLEVNARPHLAARLGGDEFAVLMEHVDDADAPVRLAQRLIGAISQPIDAHGVRAQVGLSVGVAVDLTRLAKGDAVLHAADVALRRAKADGKGRAAWTVSPAAPLD